MTGVILLTIQTVLVLSGFAGVSKGIEYYSNGSKKKEKKGGGIL